MTQPDDTLLLDTLPPLWRAALAHGGRARPLWLGLLALDVRLAGVVKQAREPMLAQIRLAWWRDRLAEPAEKWPLGEPLLAQLRAWRGEHGALGGMVDGWEALLADSPLTPAALGALGEGRARAVTALAGLAGAGASAALAGELARGWGLGDLAGVVDHPEDGATWAGLVEALAWRRRRLPKALRPVAILQAFAEAEAKNRPLSGVFALATLLRLGMLGI